MITNAQGESSVNDLKENTVLCPLLVRRILEEVVGEKESKGSREGRERGVRRGGVRGRGELESKKKKAHVGGRERRKNNHKRTNSRFTHSNEEYIEFILERKGKLFLINTIN